ncbi:ATP-binding protein [Herbaspirillum camelliae]|uniref:ATP-binding protein n=1 Tax=Herbaspirillum camelliae TaxID=1892903 RepID=UPI000949E635|nr:ATP-binding protein [Herbaspirillum camelliae]
MEISIPRMFSRETLGALFADLDNSRNIDEVTVDFSQLRFSFPLAMLVAGSKMREWVEFRSSAALDTFQKGINSGNQVHSYLMHLGFFDFIGMNHGKRVGQAAGSTTYLPICRISRPDVDIGQDGVENWYAAINEQARRLAGVLAGSYDDSQALRTYSYSIREVIRNVFEHSQAHECYVVGQRWHDGAVEIAIVDEGVGISSSLSQAHKFQLDEEALRMAIRPGISRTSGLDEDRNIYGNSGFGLYVLSELAASFGWFALGSGRAMLVGAQRDRFDHACSFKGTFFGMRFNHTPRDFSSVLNDIIESGEDSAKVEGIKVRASGQSRIS